MFPLINFPDDFPWPEYSNAKNPKSSFLAKDKKALGFFPLRSDINPWRNTIYVLFFLVFLKYLIFFDFEIL